MLEYGEIIEKLNIDEKLSILTDGNFLAEAYAEDEDVPALSIWKTEDVNGVEGKIQYPSFSALASSWNVSAVQTVAKGLTARARLLGANAVLLPEGKVRSNVYQDGASEDPFLLGTLLGSYLKETANGGITPILTGCSISASDAAYADVKPNARAIAEYYLKAFKIAAKNKANFAISTAYTHLKGEYETVNMQNVATFIKRNVAQENSFLLCEATAAEKAVARLQAGYPLCVRGHASVLKEAVKYYEDLQNSVEAGVASAEELEDAVREGRALSVDVVDEAVNRVLLFANACQTNMKKQGQTAYEPYEQELLEITEETAVLLKNRNAILPLAPQKRVAVIGQLANVGEEKSALTYIREQAGFSFAGYEAGYDLQRSRDDGLIASAKRLAENADVVIMFLGFGKEKEERLKQTKCVKLPGAQAALVETLSKLDKKIVAVVTGSGRMDMRFDTAVDAVMYMPEMGTYGGQALARLLYGKACPSGKLPFTMYDNADEHTAKERFYKDHGYNKVGTFVGYRRYDSDREKVKYPFGYGLSYTKFSYSNLKIDSRGAYVTVKNVGTCEGTEIVQFYYGKEDTKQIRPRKELCGFVRVTLRPGEAKNVGVDLQTKTFAHYDEQSGSWQTEKGYYEIYASHSVEDEGEKCVCNASGTTLTASNEKTSDYLQGKSNIVSGEYFMDTNTQRAKYKSKGLLFGIVAIVLAVLWDIFMAVFSRNIEFFSEDVGRWTGIISLIIFNALMVLGIVIMVLGAKEKERFEKEVAVKALERKKETKETVEKPVSYEHLFLEEFDNYEEDEEEEDEQTPKEDAFVIKETVDFYHRGGWSFTEMQDELIAFLLQRGIVLEAAQARTLLSAMSISRFIFLKADVGVDVLPFMSAISEFFAVNTYVDDAENYAASDDMLFKDISEKREDGTAVSFNRSYAQTQFSRAMEMAAHDEAAMKLAHLINVRPSALGGYFTQYMRYAVKPELSYNIPVKNKSISDKVFTITPNLWIFASLAEEEMVEELPAYVAETAALVRLRFTVQEPLSERMEGRAVSMAQFLSFGDKAKTRFELDEAKWKRVDKLEEYVQARTAYKISNKTWQKMEKYASVFLSLGGEMEETLDSVVAVKLLVNILALIKNNRKENDDQFFHVLENIFGEDKVNISRSVLDASAVDVDEKWYKEKAETAAKKNVRTKKAKDADSVEEKERASNPETTATSVEETTEEQAQETPSVDEEKKTEEGDKE